MARTENPYLPPTSDLIDTTYVGTADIAASRMKRLGAVLLDFTILMVLFLAVSLIAFVSDPAEFQIEFSRALEEDSSWFDINLLDGANYIGLAVNAAVFFLINGYLLAKRGQSIGKVIMNIAIISVDTAKVQPFGKLLMLRYAPIYMLQVVMNFLYFFVFIVDALLIFRRDRRTLHDTMAGTTVIDLKLQERLRNERKSVEVTDSNRDNL
ncbi:MAG: RDD family protein [Gammaproteobacteria bacterium]|nr:RDD family protein [Gammaproteobacteria bacterium]MYD80073.1 RDD family protein [Gammaproteobacteria bacterium]